MKQAILVDDDAVAREQQLVAQLKLEVSVLIRAFNSRAHAHNMRGPKAIKGAQSNQGGPNLI